MKSLQLLLSAFSLCASHSALAAYPAAIEAHQALQVADGNCEARWKELGDETTYDLGRGVRLWLVPCAQWAVNLQATAYLQIEEASRPDGFIYKQVLFIDYSSSRGLHPDVVTFNPTFNETTRTLQSQQKFDYSDLCGSKAAYQWDGKTQDLKLTTLIKNDECKTPQPWEQLFPAK